MRKAIVMTLAAIVSVQLGSAFAKDLFTAVGPLAMVWLRVTCAGVLLMVVVRPKAGGHTRRDWAILAWYAVCLIAMNVTFYQAIQRIPIGLAVTIEFLGPLSVAIAKTRRARDLPWIILAGVGVIVLGWSPGSLTWSGVAFALAAAGCWAGYILATPHVGRHWRGAEPVAWANLAGGVVLAIPVLTLARESLGNGWVWAAGLGVGLLSSVLPYALELSALRTLDQRVFSIMMSIEPAMAALFALIVLGERLSGSEIIAMACVVVASAGITWSVGRGHRSARPGSPTPPTSPTPPGSPGSPGSPA